jgi:WW domain-containing oxidoreductase
MDRRTLLGRGLALALTPCLTRAQPPDAPTSAFGPRATAEEVTAGLDLTGRTILVTGCNSGLGYETMRVLALRGAHVLGTARTRRKGREACESVEGAATPFVLELSDFDSVVDCAREIAALERPLDALICNAGVLLPERERVNGLEKQFVVNHLGHFIFVNRLLGLIQAAPAGRVVVVSSVAHWAAPPAGIDFDNLDARGDYDAALAYGQSKLANGLFAFELARRLQGTTVTSNALHPGIVDTELYRHSATRVSGGGGRRTVEQGASTVCYLAAHPAVAGVSGRYFEDCNPAEPSALLQDPALARRLWDVSTELAADYLI